MFGGLDLKGSTGNEKKQEDTPVANATPAPSAFSFLSPSTSSSAPTPPAPSSFSFLNGGGTDSSSTTQHVESKKPVTTEHAPMNGTALDHDTITSVAPPATSSPFDFLKPSANDAPPPPPPSSGFSFLTESSAKSVGSSAGDLSIPDTNPNISLVSMEATAPSMTGLSAPPAGSGIVLSATAVKKTVKKRTRTSKIGAGAQSLPPVASMPPPDIPKPPPSVDRQSHSLTDAAMEATRRAENFMNEKHLQPDRLSSVPSEEDDVIVAAKAAAAEAQQLQQVRSSSGRFKGLFRARSPQTSRPTIASSTSSISVGSGASSRDHVSAKDQDQSKRTSERQLQTNDIPSLIVQHQPYNPAPTPAPKPPVSSFSISVVAAAPAPDVLSTFIPKVETPTDKFEKILEEFTNRVKAHMDHMGQLRAHKSALVSERATAAAKKRWSQAELEQAEAQQQAAVDTEDFERADELGSSITKHEADIHEFSSIVQNIEKALAEIEKQNTDAIAAIESSFGDIRSQLEDFEATQKQDEKDQDTKSALENFSLTSKQLSAENERLQNDRKHLERDEELVATERHELEKAITEQSGEYEKLRDEARAQLEQTEAEMEELREALKAKQKLASRLRTDAAGHDESVLKVRVKFSRQINRIQKKEMHINDNKEEWETEKNTFDRQKEQHEALVQAHSEQLLAREKLLQSLKEQMDLSKSLQDVVKESLDVDSTCFGPLSSDQKLQEEVVSRRAVVSQCQHAVDAAKQEISTLQREIDFLQSDIPALEDTKKEAARRKDFKAASKASKDIKQATNRLAAARDESAEAQNALDSAEERFRAAQSDLEASQELATASEKEAAKTAVEQLAVQKKILHASSEQIDAGEEKGVPIVAKYCLQSQIKAICKQGLELSERYNIEGFAEVFGMPESTTEDIKGPPVLSHPPLETIPSEAEVDMGDDDEEVPPPPRSAPSVDNTQRLYLFLKYSTQLQELSGKQDEAAAEEDFDRAAELEDTIQEVTAALENLNLSDEEMELALSMPPPPDAAMTDEGTTEQTDVPPAAVADDPDTTDAQPKITETAEEGKSFDTEEGKSVDSEEGKSVDTEKGDPTACDPVAVEATKHENGEELVENGITNGEASL